MKCSVIVPYFNRANLAFNMLNSLDCQLFDKNEFEVILIDDGSEDLSLEDIKVRKFSINIQYHRYNKNSGRSFARNQGIKHSSGDVLIFLDCDLIVEPDYITQHLQFFEKLPEKKKGIQVGSVQYLGENFDGNIKNVDNYVEEGDSRYDIFRLFSSDMSQLRASWHLAFSGNISVPKKIVEKYGGFDENFIGWGLEDSEFGYRLFKNDVPIQFNPDIKVSHQNHESFFDKKKFEEWKKNLAYFIQKHNNELPVVLQYIFCDFFDPNSRKILENTGVKDVWLLCYQRMEYALRSFNAQESPPKSLPFLVNEDLLSIGKIFKELGIIL